MARFSNWYCKLLCIGSINLVVLIFLTFRRPSGDRNVEDSLFPHKPIVVHGQPDITFLKEHPKARQNSNQGPLLLQKLPARPPSVVIPIVVLACNRVTVSRCLDQLIRYRPSRTQFPIIISQDCGDKATEKVINTYAHEIEVLLKQPNLTNFALDKKGQKFQGYYKISRHYKFAFDQVFIKLNYQVAVIVEDDLDVSPDFFDYFLATYPILQADKSLWCVSAWNDNGKPHLIEERSDKIYRTDFFPGLGWMLLRSLWIEDLRPRWPIAFWDDVMRSPSIRNHRACLRPEVSRTTTFGKKGVSNGQHFDKYLKFIELNTKSAVFTPENMQALMKSIYDRQWTERIAASRLITENELRSLPVANSSPPEEVRVVFDSQETYKRIAKLIGCMEDNKSGVMRTAYLGSVPVIFRGHRVFIVPPTDWVDYDPKWKA